MKLLAFLALTGVVTSQQINLADQGSFQVGPMRIDSEPVMREMDYWSKWIENPETQSQAFEISRGLEDAFNMAKLRLEINGASIFRPLLKTLELVKENCMVGEDCDTDAMFQCYLAQQKYHATHPMTPFADRLEAYDHRREMSLLMGSCAKAHKCHSEHLWSRETRGQVHTNNAQLHQVIEKLSRRIQGDTGRAMQAYQGQVGQIVQGYTATVSKIMKEAYECDSECVDTLMRQVFFNPIDAMHQCNCKNPIHMDMSSQYLFRSPDLELYKLMKVDTSDYKVNEQIFRKQPEGLTQLATTYSNGDLAIDVFDSLDGLVWQEVEQGQRVMIRHPQMDAPWDPPVNEQFNLDVTDNTCDGYDYYQASYMNNSRNSGSYLAGGNQYYWFDAPKSADTCTISFHRKSDDLTWHITIVTKA